MKLKGTVYSVGVVDKKIRIFHGYETPLGTTYNAYLVVDEQVTLVDFVKENFAGQLLDNIKEVLGERPVDNIICNHVEPDHSGALPQVVAAYPNAKIYGTANCLKGLTAYYRDVELNFVVVKKGDSLCTGRYNFNFIPMPMVHWPDSMATYLAEEELLFSNDAFGQHYGGGELLDTEIEKTMLLERVANYYANIVLPFGMQVKNVAGVLSQYPISMICPSHGVALSECSIAEVLQSYTRWASGEVQPKKLAIIYDTMWHTTEKMAEQLREEYAAQGFDVTVLSLSDVHYSEAMSQLLECSHIFVGSPTLNNGMMPTVAAFLEYMKGLKPKNRTGMAFGAYGWSGESINDVEKILTSCGFEMLPSRKVQWNT